MQDDAVAHLAAIAAELRAIRALLAPEPPARPSDPAELQAWLRAPQQAAAQMAIAAEVSRLWDKFAAQGAECAPVQAGSPVSPSALAGQSTPACSGANR